MTAGSPSKQCQAKDEINRKYKKTHARKDQWVQWEQLSREKQRKRPLHIRQWARRRIQKVYCGQRVSSLSEAYTRRKSVRQRQRQRQRQRRMRQAKCGS